MRVRVPRAPLTAVLRPRLFERLGECSTTLLTLVSAPAGFGKTTLLSSWLHSDRGPACHAWLSLASTDDDPRRLWTNLIEALSAAEAGPGHQALAALRVAPTGPRGDVAQLLAAALDQLDRPLVCVLDDAHLLTSPAAFAELAALLRYVPSQLRLVIATRTDPPLPLPRLRIDGSLSELRAEELAFTVEEAGALLEQIGITLEPDLVLTLRDRTEGWAAGLRLAAISLVRTDSRRAFVERFAGDDRTVAEYLLSEVLANQPAKTRSFLLRTSIAERLTGELANALTGRRDGARMLATLEHDNVFIIAADPSGSSYRYHGLFSDLLQNELRYDAPHELPELHRRAAAWHAERGHALLAIRHAIAGEQWALAIELLVTSSAKLVMAGRGAELRSLLGQLPRDLAAQHPELALVYASDRLELGDVAGAEPYIATADAGEVEPEHAGRYQLTRAAVELQHDRLSGTLAVVGDDVRRLLTAVPAKHGDRQTLGLRDLGSVELLAGQLDEAERDLRAALALARRAGYDYVTVGCLSLLAAIELRRCRLSLAIRIAEEALSIAGPAGWLHAPQLGWAHLALAMSHFARGSNAQGARAVQHARACIASSGEASLGLVATAVEAHASAIGGDRREVEAALHAIRAARDANDGPAYTPIIRIDLRALELRLLLMLGRTEEAALELDRIATTDGGLVGRGQLMRARLELAMGETAVAQRALAQFGSEAPVDDFAVVEGRLLSAAVALAERDDRSALAALEQALDAAEPEGYRMPFLDASIHLRGLLEQALRTGTAHRALVGELLAALRHGIPPPTAVRELLEPLSDREEVVLRFLPTELSNAEIASEMFVSVNTVKTHLRSVYRKLDVTRRHDAVERARDLRLLAPGGLGARNRRGRSAPFR